MLRLRFSDVFGTKFNTPSTKISSHTDEVALNLSVGEVRKTLKKVNVHKAAGPDNILG